MRMLLLLLTVAGSACISTHLVELNPPPRAASPRPVESVQIYASGAPDRPHVDVALIFASGHSSSLDDYIRDLHERGAHLGCDSIVLAPGHIGTATCVYFLDVPPANQEPTDDHRGLVGKALVPRGEDLLE